MTEFNTISISYFKKAFISLSLIGITGFALASMGGGKNKKKSKVNVGNINTIRTTNGFTLKTGPTYKGSLTFGTLNNNKGTIYCKSILTYQQGNTIYILPYRYKIHHPINNLQSSTGSLQMFNLRFKIGK